MKWRARPCTRQQSHCDRPVQDKCGNPSTPQMDLPAFILMFEDTVSCAQRNTAPTALKTIVSTR
jgi:hypothetical protein